MSVPRPRLKTRPNSLGGDPREGAIVAARYRLDKLLGKGGMGSVWVGWDTELEREVAVKFMATEIAARPELRDRFTREAKAAAGLRTRHVVGVYDYGVDGLTPYIVMELLEGEDLRARLKVRRRLPPPDVVHIVAQAGKALGRAQRAGIVHRDLKPANIFLAKVDDEEVVKVLDFGVAKTTGPDPGSHATKTGVVLGSPPYMSPEQARGKKLDHRSDVWSLAAVAYRTLTGKVAFTGDSDGDVIVKICTESPPPPSTHLPSLPPEMDALFARAFAADPDKRFQSARALSEALARTVGMPQPAPSMADRSGPHHAASPSDPLADSGGWSGGGTPASGGVYIGGTPASGAGLAPATPASSASNPSMEAAHRSAPGPAQSASDAARAEVAAGPTQIAPAQADAEQDEAERAAQEAPTVAIATPSSGSLVLTATPLAGTPRRSTAEPSSGEQVLATPAGGSAAAAVPSSGAPSALTPQTWQADEPFAPPRSRQYLWVVGGVCAAAVLLIVVAAAVGGGPASDAEAPANPTATPDPAPSATLATDADATASTPAPRAAASAAAAPSATSAASARAATHASATSTATKTRRPAAKHHPQPTTRPRPLPKPRPKASSGPKKPSWGY